MYTCWRHWEETKQTEDTHRLAQGSHAVEDNRAAGSRAAADNRAAADSLAAAGSHRQGAGSHMLEDAHKLEDSRVEAHRKLEEGSQAGVRHRPVAGNCHRERPPPRKQAGRKDMQLAGAPRNRKPSSVLREHSLLLITEQPDAHLRRP